MAYVYQIAAASFGDMVSEQAMALNSCHLSTVRMSYAYGLQRTSNVLYKSKHYKPAILRDISNALFSRRACSDSQPC